MDLTPLVPPAGCGPAGGINQHRTHFFPKSSGFEMSVRVVCTGWQTGSVGSVL